MTNAQSIPENYEKLPDLVYRDLGARQLSLDIYRPKGLKTPNTTLIFFYGGGWYSGEKSNPYWLDYTVPWMRRGFTVIVPDYRLSGQASAPAIVEDCQSAVAWAVEHASEYLTDVEKIVLCGASAGGHLALMAGMAPGVVKVAAIVNFFGVTDVADVLVGPNAQGYASAFVPEDPDRMDIAAQISPINHVRPGLPPIMTIHGDADPFVPYSQAVRLRAALKRAGVPELLHTVHGGEHNHFTDEENAQIEREIDRFLSEQDLKD